MKSDNNHETIIIIHTDHVINKNIITLTAQLKQIIYIVTVCTYVCACVHACAHLQTLKVRKYIHTYPLCNKFENKNYLHTHTHTHIYINKINTNVAIRYHMYVYSELTYCSSEWQAQRHGVIIEQHHRTNKIGRQPTRPEENHY